MKKMILMAAVLLSSMGAFAQAPAGTFTLQPKVGVNVSTLTNLDANSKAGFFCVVIAVLTNINSVGHLLIIPPFYI